MTDITTRLLSMSEAMYMDRDQDELDALLLEAKAETERLRADCAREANLANHMAQDCFEQQKRAEAAEKDRDSLQEHVYALMDKIDALSAHETCGCSWDKPNDLCMHHSPRLAAAEKRCEELKAALRDQFCPRPCNGRPDQFDVGDCVDAGECGCSAALVLIPSEQKGNADGK